MPRRKRNTTAVRVVRTPAPRAAAPIIKIAQPRAPAAHTRRRRRSTGRRARSFVGGALDSGVEMAIGGAIYGFAVKQGLVQKLPAVPMIGRTGTAAILLHLWAKRGGGPMVKKVATAAAVIAGYQLGSTGAITGEDENYGPDLPIDGDDAYSDGDD